MAMASSADGGSIDCFPESVTYAAKSIHHLNDTLGGTISRHALIGVCRWTSEGHRNQERIRSAKRNTLEVPSKPFHPPPALESIRSHPAFGLSGARSRPHLPPPLLSSTLDRPGMDVPRAPPGWSAGASSLATSAPFGSGTDIFILCGKWYDSNGSKYVVDKNKFDQLDVTTERPDGSRIHTSRLIRLEGGNVHWGSHYVLDVNDDVKNALDELRVGHPGVLRTFRWLSKEGKPAFVWKR